MLHRTTAAVVAALIVTTHALGAQAKAWPELDKERKRAPDWALAHRAALPAPPDARTLFRQATSTPEALRGDLVVCRVRYKPTKRQRRKQRRGALWTLGMNKPDLLVRFRVGTRGRLDRKGPEDAYSGVVAIPKLHLRSGQRVTVTLYDRDAASKTRLGRVSGKFRGSWPWTMSNARVDIECRVPSQAQLDSRVDRLAPQATRLLGKLKAREPDTFRAQLGYPHVDRKAAERLVLTMASYRGWGDPRVLLLVKALADHRTRWDKAMMAALRKAARRGPQPLGEHYEVQVAGLLCGKDARRAYGRRLGSRFGGYRLGARDTCTIALTVRLKPGATPDAAKIAIGRYAQDRAYLSLGRVVYDEGTSCFEGGFIKAPDRKGKMRWSRGALVELKPNEATTFLALASRCGSPATLAENTPYFGRRQSPRTRPWLIAVQLSSRGRALHHSQLYLEVPAK